MSSLAQLEAELATCQDDIDTCNEMLALEPDDNDSIVIKAEREATKVDLQAKIAAKKAEQSAAAAPPPPPPSSSTDAPPPPPDDAAHTFEVKDNVMAKWSEDKQWYPATIVTKTGSSTDPVYKVTFKGYGNTETKRKHEVRPMVDPYSKKRKADGTPVVNAPAPQQPAPPKSVKNGSVISAAPSVDTTLMQKKEPSKVSDGPTRLAPEPKKLKGAKVLEKGKSSWQNFQKAGPKKTGFGGGGKLGKESQFRTPDLPNARVGFTGSGKPMQKDQARQKWNYTSETLDEQD